MRLQQQRFECQQIVCRASYTRRVASSYLLAPKQSSVQSTRPVSAQVALSLIKCMILFCVCCTQRAADDEQHKRQEQQQQHRLIRCAGLQSDIKLCYAIFSHTRVALSLLHISTSKICICMCNFH